MQQRQLPKSMSEHALLEVTAIRRQRARRVQLVAAGIGASLLALLATGCPEPADLANPQLYDAPPPSAGSGSTAGGGTGADPCEVACVAKVFAGSTTSCKLCHSTAMETRLGQLDLQSANVTSRLKDVASKHVEIMPPPTAGDCPTGDKLIDVANPAESWMLKKLKGLQKTCGTVMPSTAPLGAADLACMETYVACVAGKPIGGGGGAAAGGSGGSAGSGGSGGSAAGGTSAGTGGTTAGAGGGGGTGGT